MLSYQKVTDRHTGEVSFKPNFNEKFPPLKNTSLLVIDESSMLSLEMLVYLELYGKNCTIIFVGDDKQINPVGEEDSPVFLGKPRIIDAQFIQELELEPGEILGKHPTDASKAVIYTPYPEVELTEIVRQGAGNPIIPLSRSIDGIWQYQKRTVEEDTKGFLYTVNEPKIIEELAKVNGTDEFKYLAYDNKDVDRMNMLVRRKIYGNSPAKIEQGETIVFDSPYGEFMTNQELLVERCAIDTVTFKVPIESNSQTGRLVISETPLKVYIINGYKSDDWRDGKETWKGIFVIHEDCEAQYKSLIKTLSVNCARKILDYVTRNNFLDNFAQFKYNHAITIHKSQGSTYKNVILNVRTVSYSKSEKEKQRLYYTAITRASDLLILYNV